MHDPGTQLAADSPQIPTMGQKSVHQSSVLVPGRRVNHQSRRFVEHQQRCVLVHDPQRNILGAQLRAGAGLARRPRDDFAHPQLARGRHRLPVDRDRTLRHMARELRAGDLGKFGRQDQV